MTQFEQSLCGVTLALQRILSLGVKLSSFKDTKEIKTELIKLSSSVVSQSSNKNTQRIYVYTLFHHRPQNLRIELKIILHNIT